MGRLRTLSKKKRRDQLLTLQKYFQLVASTRLELKPCDVTVSSRLGGSDWGAEGSTGDHPSRSRPNGLTG
jgi:hypothetical protein